MTRGEGGFSLLEVMIAVVILGLAFATILGGMGASIAASARHREQVDASAVLISAAERVKSSATPYVACATPATYQTAAQAGPFPAGWGTSNVAITGVTYRGEGEGTDAFGAVCYDDAAHLNLLHLQLVTITVTSPSGATSDSFAVVKARR